MKKKSSKAAKDEPTSSPSTPQPLPTDQRERLASRLERIAKLEEAGDYKTLTLMANSSSRHSSFPVKRTTKRRATESDKEFEARAGLQYELDLLQRDDLLFLCKEERAAARRAKENGPVGKASK